MFNVVVEWLDRAEMSPPVPDEPPRASFERIRITRSLAEQEELWKRFRR